MRAMQNRRPYCLTRVLQIEQFYVVQVINNLIEEGEIKLSRTRWVERHEGFEVFSDLLQPTVSGLEALPTVQLWSGIRIPKLMLNLFCLQFLSFHSS